MLAAGGSNPACFGLQRRAPAWEHLGLLGPVIRGAVGDTLKVTFKNNLKEQAVSMHPHGVWYDKDSEGSPYSDGLAREQLSMAWKEGTCPLYMSVSWQA